MHKYLDTKTSLVLDIKSEPKKRGNTVNQKANLDFGLSGIPTLILMTTLILLLLINPCWTTYLFIVNKVESTLMIVTKIVSLENHAQHNASWLRLSSDSFRSVFRSVFSN